MSVHILFERACLGPEGDYDSVARRSRALIRGLIEA